MPGDATSPGLWSNIVALWNALAALTAKFVAAVALIWQWINNILDMIRDNILFKLLQLWDMVINFKEWVKRKVFEILKKHDLDIWIVRKAVDKAIDWVFSQVEKYFKLAVEKIHEVFDFLDRKVDEFFGDLTDKIEGTAKSIIDWVSEKFGIFQDAIKEWLEEIWFAIKTTETEFAKKLEKLGQDVNDHIEASIDKVWDRTLGRLTEIEALAGETKKKVDITVIGVNVLSPEALDNAVESVKGAFDTIMTQLGIMAVITQKAYMRVVHSVMEFIFGPAATDEETKQVNEVDPTTYINEGLDELDSFDAGIYSDYTVAIMDESDEIDKATDKLIAAPVK